MVLKTRDLMGKERRRHWKNLMQKWKLRGKQKGKRSKKRRRKNWKLLTKIFASEERD